MKRISKKVREEAALICAIAASEIQSATTQSVGVDLGLHGQWGSSASSDLAYLAWLYAWGHCVSHNYAEAESLLRCNWSPGEEP